MYISKATGVIQLLPTGLDASFPVKPKFSRGTIGVKSPLSNTKQVLQKQTQLLSVLILVTSRCLQIETHSCFCGKHLV